jgi:ankyrin repeat protein
MIPVSKKKKMNVFQCDKRDRRPIHGASFRGHEAVVRLLLQHGAEVEVQDKVTSPFPGNRLCSKLARVLFLFDADFFPLKQDNSVMPSVSRMVDSGSNIASKETNLV